MKRWHCRKLRKKLPDYAGGALEERERIDIEKHLAQCAKCQKDLELYTALFTAVDKIDKEDRDAFPAESYWESYAARISQKLELRKERKTKVLWSPRSVYYLVPACTILLLTIIGIIQVSQRKSPWDSLTEKELTDALQIALSPFSVQELVSFIDTDGEEFETLEDDIIVSLGGAEMMDELGSVANRWNSEIRDLDFFPDIAEFHEGEENEIIDKLLLFEMEGNLYEKIGSFNPEEREDFFRLLEQSAFDKKSNDATSGV
jgi:hypothetical protein